LTPAPLPIGHHLAVGAWRGGRSGVCPPPEGVDPGFVRHLRVSIRGLSAFGRGGHVVSVCYRPAPLPSAITWRWVRGVAVGPGFVRHLRVSIRVSSAFGRGGFSGKCGGRMLAAGRSQS